MDTDERRLILSLAFAEQYGGEPSVWSRAPGRVDLMGSHTDYNQGYVMTMTVDRDTWIAAHPREDGVVAVYSLNVAGGGEFSLDRIERDEEAPWTNYVRGVADVLRRDGRQLRGFDALVHSTIPFGSGLSSSAALEMATLVTFQSVSGFELDGVEMAVLGQRAENEFVGVPCGILDQYSSAMGRAGSSLLLDCRDLSSRTVPIAEDIAVVICDTRAARNLAGTEYQTRRAQCEEGVRFLRSTHPGILTLRDVSLEAFEAQERELPDTVAKRCRFIIEENQRVLDLAQALPDGDRATLANLFAQSWSGARDLYEISVPAMQLMVDAMLRSPGVIGARQAGAGFGGCMVALVERHAVAAFAANVVQTYSATSGIQPGVYSVVASDGAGPVQ
ncbi:MAG: galactokinase [Caldilineaceae bacterium]